MKKKKNIHLTKKEKLFQFEGQKRRKQKWKNGYQLSNAAMEGDIKSLQQLLQEDPLILHSSIVSCASETPLHVSSMLGHLNSRRLVKVDTEMSIVRNQNEWTPLHLAATKCRSARVVTERDETALHLSVGSNRLPKILFPVFGFWSCTAVLSNNPGPRGRICRDDDTEMVNHKDCEGNTLLHIAVAKTLIEICFLFISILLIIKFLLTIPGLDINAMNKNGFTALDTLKQSPRDLRDMEIESILRDAGVLSSKDRHVIAVKWVPSPSNIPKIPKSLVSNKSKKSETNSRMPIRKKEHTDWLSRKRSALMVWATDKETRQMWIQMVSTWVAINAQVITYFRSLRHMSPDTAVESSEILHSDCKFERGTTIWRTPKQQHEEKKK
ncbi:hypothetical protein CXB51_014820 [Gossypium anomalum]|uniref:Uncharacterized protein n=1 Tax=Gossypium anomalum TaxID=47600 RepID=A0A8J5ZLN5_9ROSI|nr:hypothetical protein CXB51_014820 [Gossypium anomalum]